MYVDLMLCKLHAMIDTPIKLRTIEKETLCIFSGTKSVFQTCLKMSRL